MMNYSMEEATYAAAAAANMRSRPLLHCPQPLLDQWKPPQQAYPSPPIRSLHQPAPQTAVVATAGPGAGHFRPFSGDVASLLPNGLQAWEYDNRRRMQEIVKNVFLGSYASAKKTQLPELQRVGITHIVCARHEWEANVIKPNFEHEIRYKVVDLADDPRANILQHFASVNAFISEALACGGRVLIHSNSGISRNGALMIAFVMEHYCMTYHQAARLVTLGRGCISPNDGFKAQLQQFEPLYQAKKMATSFRGGGGVKRGLSRDRDDDDDDHGRGRDYDYDDDDDDAMYEEE